MYCIINWQALAWSNHIWADLHMWHCNDCNHTSALPCGKLWKLTKLRTIGAIRITLQGKEVHIACREAKEFEGWWRRVRKMENFWGSVWSTGEFSHACAVVVAARLSWFQKYCRLLARLSAYATPMLKQIWLVKSVTWNQSCEKTAS